MIELRMTAGQEAASALSAVKAVAWDFPGEERLTVRVAALALVLGPEWSYDASEGCLAALGEFGEAVLHAG